jgi:hypothetical protein
LQHTICEIIIKGHVIHSDLRTITDGDSRIFVASIIAREEDALSVVPPYIAAVNLYFGIVQDADGGCIKRLIPLD